MKEIIVVFFTVIGQPPEVSYIDPEDRPCQEVLAELQASVDESNRYLDLLVQDDEGHFLWRMECKFVEVL